MEQVKELIVYIAPIAAGFITSILIPFLIKKISLRSLEKKIEEVNEATELNEIKRKLDYIIKEISEMRGRR